MKSVSDVITEQIIRITESQLISPWSSYGMGALTSAVSNNIQDKIIKNQLHSEMKRIEEELNNLEQKENKTAEDLNNITKLNAEISEKNNLNNDKQSYSSIINHEAKKYTIAYSQCENIYYAQQKNNITSNTIISKEVKSHADGVKTDKPADVADMFTMAAENGIYLKIVDDPNYQLTEEDKEKSTKVAIFIKGDKDIEGKDNIGHWMLKDENSFIPIDSKNNDCGYAIFEKLTGKSVEQLRNETSQRIKDNSENFSKAIKSQSWIQSLYPKETNSLLFNGSGVLNELKRIQQIKDIKSKQNYLNNKIDEMAKKYIIPINTLNSIRSNISKTSSADELNKAAVFLYLLEKCGNINSKYPNEILSGGFVEIDDNGELYNKFKSMGYKERNFGEQAIKIKKLSEKQDLFKKFIETDYTNINKITKKYFVETFKQKLKEVEAELKQNNKAISIQAGDIFEEIKVEQINGKTRVKLDANKYPHDPRSRTLFYSELRKGIIISKDLFQVNTDNAGYYIENKLNKESPNIEINNTVNFRNKTREDILKGEVNIGTDVRQFKIDNTGWDIKNKG